MERPAVTDVRRLLEFVHDLSAPGDTDRSRRRVIEQMLELIPCVNGVYYERTERRFEASAAGDFRFPAAVVEAERVYGPQRPTAACRVPAGGATRLSDRISRRDLVPLDFYQHAMRPIGIEDELVLVLPSRKGSIAGFSFISDRRFTDRDLAVLELLGPYLTAAHDRLASSRNRGDVELTKREWDVMALVARGRTNKEIAAVLLISPQTVRKHLENVFPKLGVYTRTAAVVRAYPHGNR